MGVNAEVAVLLSRLCVRGVSFEKTLTIGRQWLFVSPRSLASICNRAGLNAADLDNYYKNQADWGWSDGLFRCLGAKELDVLDYSDYEKANILHDLNKPLKGHDCAYDLVFDGGTLEHVFFTTTALANCVRLVKVGGHLVLFLPANNECGHGFYQFSPDYYFRALDEKQGFKILELLIFQSPLLGRTCWHRVVDSASLGARTGLMGGRPAYVMVVARKTEHVEPFVSVPLQSDYIAAWSGISASGEKSSFQRKYSLKEVIKNCLSKLLLDGLLYRYRILCVANLRNKRFYTPVDKFKW